MPMAKKPPATSLSNPVYTKGSEDAKVKFLGMTVVSAYTIAVNGIETVVEYAVLKSVSSGVIWCQEA